MDDEIFRNLMALQRFNVQIFPINYINTKFADALAPCIIRASAASTLCVKDTSSTRKDFDYLKNLMWNNEWKYK